MKPLIDFIIGFVAGIFVCLGFVVLMIQLTGDVSGSDDGEEGDDYD